MSSRVMWAVVGGITGIAGGTAVGLARGERMRRLDDGLAARASKEARDGFQSTTGRPYDSADSHDAAVLAQLEESRYHTLDRRAEDKIDGVRDSTLWGGFGVFAAGLLVGGKVKAPVGTGLGVFGAAALASSAVTMLVRSSE